MRKQLITICLALMPLWAFAQADDPTDTLLLELRDMEQLQGAFTQRQFNYNGVLLVETSGRFRLLRPGYFSWEITAPDSQLIIADPQHLWHHDRDLETVTRRPVGDSAQMSPLQVLGGDEAALRDRFDVTQPKAKAFTLTPKPDSGDPGFHSLTLQLDGEGIRGMEILDKLDQRIVISFTELDADSGLTPADFVFTPPEGVDLFYYDE